MTTFSFDATKTENTALRVGIVCSRFNEFIVQALLDGAHRGLKKCGIDEKKVDVAWVPGAYEIPLAARAMALSGRYELLIALGAVIRGDTAHFEYVAGPCADGIARVQQDTGLPIGFAVLTTENVEQAAQRSGPSAGNKGEEAAIGAIETWHVLQSIRAPK